MNWNTVLFSVPDYLAAAHGTNGSAQVPQSYNAYVPPQHSNSQTMTASQSYAAAPASIQSAYDPYALPAPPVNSSASQAYTPASVSSQSAYGSYAPSAPSNYAPSAPSNYAPPAPTASGQVAYGSYVAPVQSNYGVPSYTAPPQNSYGYSAPTGATIPPPPPPATKLPLNRPKVSNAYDPPFPTAPRKQPRNATSPSINHFTSFSPPPSLPPSQRSVLPPPPPPSNGSPRPPSVPHSIPPASSSNYSGMTRAPSHSANIEGLPHTNGAGASFSAYAPSRSISYEPSGAVQSYASTDNMTHNSHYDPHNLPSEEVKPENNQSNPESFTHQSVADVPDSVKSYVDAHDNPVNQTFHSEYTSSQHTSPPPRTNSYSTPSTTPGGPPMRASSAASVRVPRTRSPLTIGSEPSRPRSSNSGIRMSPPSSTQHSASSSFDLYAPKVGQIPEERIPSPDLTPNTTFDPYAPNNRSSPAPSHRLNSNLSLSSDPYAPTNSHAPTSSAISSAPPQSNGPYGANTYLPGTKAVVPPRNRSTSNGSMLSTLSEDTGPYAASNHSRLKSNEPDYGSYTSRYNYLDNEQASPVPEPSSSGFASSGLGSGQELSMKAPTYTPYAPSPSLLGTNDPLGRAGARVPVFSFGFGGKFVTCFHGADKMNTGFDVALASRNSTGVEIRVLNKIIPSSVLNLSSTMFPGPLFSDPGSPTVGLVRPGAAAQTKTKKARVIKYLEDRAEELSQGLGYMLSGSEDQGRTESKVVLFKILKVLVENDGKLSGT